MTNGTDTAPKTQAPKKTSGMVTYTPKDPSEVETTWGGKRFVAGVPVQVNDPDMLEKAIANPYFSVDGQDVEADAEKRAAEAAKAEAEANAGVIKAEGEALKRRQKGETEQLEAKHKAESEAQAAREKAAAPEAAAAPAPSGRSSRSSG